MADRPLREAESLSGVVVTGLGRGASFTRIPWARAQIRSLLGADPWPGTLNLKAADLARWRAVAARPGTRLSSPEGGSCDARSYPAYLERLRALIVVPEVPGYPEDQIEVVSAENLRSRLGLSDGDRVKILVARRP